MNTDYIQSIVRNIVQVIAGYFVAKGLLDKDNAELLIAGAASIAVAAYGIWHQWKHRVEKEDLTIKLGVKP